jgi:hypothetical protein
MAQGPGIAVTIPCAEEPFCSAAARRMRRHRIRRKNRLRCVTVELREREIDALLRRAGLPPEDRADHTAIRTALYGFFDNHLR